MGIHSEWLPRKIKGRDALLVGADGAVQEKNATGMKAFVSELIGLNKFQLDDAYFSKAMELLDVLSLLGKSQYRRVVNFASDLGMLVLEQHEQRRKVFRLLASNMTRAHNVEDYDMAQYSAAFASYFALPDHKAEVKGFYKPLEQVLGNALYRWDETKGFDHDKFDTFVMLAHAALVKRAFGEAAHAINLAAFVAKKAPDSVRRLEKLSHGWQLGRECAQMDVNRKKPSLVSTAEQELREDKTVILFTSPQSKRPQSIMVRQAKERAAGALAIIKR